jgi:hypothetical protein
MKLNKTFITATTSTILFFLVISVALVFLFKNTYWKMNNYIFLFLASILIFIMGAFILTGLKVLLTKRYMPKSKFIYWLVKNLLMPILNIVFTIFKMDVSQLEKFYIEFNNMHVNAIKAKVKCSDILIVLPHCLQDKDCRHKITNNINNCTKCGRCEIPRVIDLANKWNLEAVVVSGGTSARDKIKKRRPRAVVAVACERDLASGIKDVSVIPVLGILNQRPNGPCVNTKVRVEEIEQAIEKLALEEYAYGIEGDCTSSSL